MLPETLRYLMFAGIGLAVSVLIYFFAFTRFSLIFQAFSKRTDPKTEHIYWIYKSPLLIWLTDRRFLTSLILLNQYDRLVAAVVRQLNPSLAGKRVLQISCAFGSFSERIAQHCAEEGAKEFVVTDIMQSEVDHARRKLRRFGELCQFARQDAVQLALPDESFDYVVMFFLPHEVPYRKKHRILAEAKRVLRPGGKLVVGEFHRPRVGFMRILGQMYFRVFEPYALDMWGRFNLLEEIVRSEGHGGFDTEKQTFMLDNFQVVAATKAVPDPGDKPDLVKKKPQTA